MSEQEIKVVLIENNPDFVNFFGAICLELGLEVIAVFSNPVLAIRALPGLIEVGANLVLSDNQLDDLDGNHNADTGQKVVDFLRERKAYQQVKIVDISRGKSLTDTNISLGKDLEAKSAQTILFKYLAGDYDEFLL